MDERLKKVVEESKNIVFLRDYAFKKYDACISTEDDNEFAPCALDYFNKALSFYKANL